MPLYKVVENEKYHKFLVVRVNDDFVVIVEDTEEKANEFIELINSLRR